MSEMADKWAEKNTRWKTVKCEYFDCPNMVRVSYIKGQKRRNTIFCKEHKEKLDK